MYGSGYGNEHRGQDQTDPEAPTDDSKETHGAGLHRPGIDARTDGSPAPERVGVQVVAIKWFVGDTLTAANL